MNREKSLTIFKICIHHNTRHTLFINSAIFPRFYKMKYENMVIHLLQIFDTYLNSFSSRFLLHAFIFSQQRLNWTAERIPWGPTIELYSLANCDHADFRLYIDIGSDLLSSISSYLFIKVIRISRSSKLYVFRVLFNDEEAILARKKC